jgi:hypothetical protein
LDTFYFFIFLGLPQLSFHTQRERERDRGLCNVKENDINIQQLDEKNRWIHHPTKNTKGKMGKKKKKNPIKHIKQIIVTKKKQRDITTMGQLFRQIIS